MEEEAGMNAMAAKERALKLAPEDREIILEVARSWQARAQPTLATWVLEGGLKYLPQDEELWAELIALYWEAENIPALVDAYREYIKLRPDQAVLYYELGLALSRNGQLAEAVVNLEKARRLEPDNYDYLQNLFILESQLEHYEKALDLAQTMLDARPGHLPLWEELHARLGQTRPAQLSALLAQDLAAHERPLPKYYEILALLALKRGQPGEAAGIMEKAREAYPSNLRILFLLGNIYEGMGEEKKALDFYEQIINEDPNYQEASERYLQLKIRLLREGSGRN
jgi:tetratricopeptide (TPR) repeat protein